MRGHNMVLKGRFYIIFLKLNPSCQVKCEFYLFEEDNLWYHISENRNGNTPDMK